MTRIMTKTSLILLSAWALSGCATVDDAINGAVNDTLSGEVTTETMLGKDKVLIINEVSRTACVVIKNGLEIDDDMEDAETLVTELGVNCATYGKAKGDLTDSDAECTEQLLKDWLKEGNEHITDFESAQGDKACVIGFNDI